MKEFFLLIDLCDFDIHNYNHHGNVYLTGMAAR